jgi:hypothetical protein
MIRFASAVVLAGLLAIAPARGADDDYEYDEPGDSDGGGEPETEPYYGDGGAGAPPEAERDAVLASHGTWVRHASWGRVWRPRVTVGWRPYTHGYWGWSPYGWTWVSSEPWGWSYHYGRWGWYDHYGWVWVPGTVWAPAWVDWWEADGWIGWAPLGPAGWVGVRHHYVFVRDHDFCDRRLRHRIHHHHHVSSFGRHGWSGRRGGPPPLHRIERVSRHPLVRVPNPRRGDSLGTHRLPSPTRPDGAHARRGGRDVRPAPVLPRGFQDGRRHDGRTRVPRVPDRVQPGRPSEPFRPGSPTGGRHDARRERWQRPPGRAEFGRPAHGGPRVQSPMPRSHFRGEGGGSRGTERALRGQPGGGGRVGAPPSIQTPAGGHRIGPGGGGTRGGPVGPGGERSGSAGGGRGRAHRAGRAG